MIQTVDAALAHARALGLERLDAQLLLAQALHRPRAWLLAHGEDSLTGPQHEAFAASCARRADGEPLAYLLGEREFHGLMLHITPDVLVPRPDTETLVDWALELLSGALSDVDVPEVLDLGTGSGAIALALKHRRARSRVCATDVSAAAIDIARRNATTHRTPIEFFVGDWWQPLGERRFHLVVSNPPYVADDDVHLRALRHEPRGALTPGGNGLGAIARLVRGAPEHLYAGGWLLLEHGAEQAEAVQGLLVDTGFAHVGTRADLAGLPRCSGGRLNPA